MIARVLSRRNDWFRLVSVRACARECDERRKNESKSSENRSQIAPKSTPNRSKIDEKSLREPSARSWTIRGGSGTLPVRSGHAPESSQDTPGRRSGGLRALRAAPGRPRDVPKTRRRAFGGRFLRRSRAHPFSHRCPDVFSRFPCRVRVARRAFHSRRRSRNACRAFCVARALAQRKRTKIERKWSENGGRTPPRASRAPTERPGERSFTQDARFFF